MRYTIYLLVFLMSNGLFSAASFAQTQNAVLAKVNGTAITEQALEAYVHQQFGPEASVPMTGTPQREMLINTLINRTLLVQQALQAGLDKNPQVQAEVEDRRQMVLSNAFTHHWHQDFQPTEKQLKAFYQQRSNSMPTLKQYKTRHIVTTTEEQAKAVITQLKNGNDFAKLAREKSVDATKAQGGSLGWLTLQQMFPPYAQAITTLQPNQFTQMPVQTPSGWHVALLEEVREMPKPTYEAVKEGLKQEFKNMQWQQFVNQLRNQAKIKR